MKLRQATLGWGSLCLGSQQALSSASSSQGAQLRDTLTVFKEPPGLLSCLIFLYRGFSMSHQPVGTNESPSQAVIIPLAQPHPCPPLTWSFGAHLSTSKSRSPRDVHGHSSSQVYPVEGTAKESGRVGILGLERRDPLEVGDQGSGGPVSEQPQCYPHPLGALLFLICRERGVLLGLSMSSRQLQTVTWALSKTHTSSYATQPVCSRSEGGYCGKGYSWLGSPHHRSHRS